MKYVYLQNNTVIDIIPEFDSAFPDVPIDERFTAEFIEQLIPTNEDAEIGYIYEDGKFKEAT